ncbi:MAG: metallophosphoesterase [Nanoarchaeota archaeon]
MNRGEIVERFLSKNLLVSPDFFECADIDEVALQKLPEREGPIVLNKDIIPLLKNSGKVSEINWMEFEKTRAAFEKGKDIKIYKTFLDILSYHYAPETKKMLDSINNEIKVPEGVVKVENQSGTAGVIVTKNYVDEDLKQKDVSNFVQYFKLRFNALRNILLSRPELRDAVSINRIINKKDREEVSFVGMLQNKRKTKNGNYLLDIEDITGKVTVIAEKRKETLMSIACDLVLDEVIGMTGIASDGVVYASSIFLPDIPLSNKVKKCADDVEVAFISDIHVGSGNFLEKEFLKFIKWLNEDKKAIKIKYLFVIGDVVDGIGVYPGQENNSVILDAGKQYSELARCLRMIRKNINIILCPGDHDAVRLTHPQPVLDKKLAKDLWELENLTLVTNPSVVNIHSGVSFSGFDILLYHGHGYHYYTSNVESIRKNDPVNNPRHVMKFLLQRRHLAPTHASTIYIPDNRFDPMLIDKVPDIFASGHLHKCDIGDYNGVITINTSCWQSITDFEIKTGNNPDPGKVPVLNLKTREVEVFNFYE